MSTSRQLLLGSCARALATFDSSTSAVEDHLDRFLHSPECKLSSEEDCTFLREVFSGCVQYRKLIEVVVDGYYSSESSNCLRIDYCLYQVLTYLLLFRLEEMGVASWKRLFNSQHPGKMHKFLHFIFQNGNLKGWITAKWYKVYDQQFVDAAILSPLERHEAEIKLYIDQLQNRVENRSPPSQSSSKPPIEPLPFTLTTPTFCSLPSPEKIPFMKPRKPVPASTYSKPVEQDKLAKAFRENKMKAKVAFEEAKRPKLSVESGRSEKAKVKPEPLLPQTREESKHKSKLKSEPASIVRERSKVKLNTATVLREGARVQREEMEREKRLASLEAGEKDDFEFTRWKEEMKQREAAEQLTEMERKHLQVQLSYEEAIIARESHRRDIRDKAQALREETKALMRDYFAEREGQRRELRRLVEATMASHHNTREAKAQLTKMKKKIVQGVCEESREKMARALEEAEEELRSKVELIQQIRAMESVPIPRIKFLDLTETGGLGLLSEMSTAELRERLALLKVAASEEKEKKRQDIVASRQAREQLLSKTMEFVSQHQKERSREAISKHQEEERQFSRHHHQLREEKVIGLQEKLQLRRKERQRLRSEAMLKQSDPDKKMRMQGSNSTSSRDFPPATTGHNKPITCLLLQATNQTAVS